MRTVKIALLASVAAAALTTATLAADPIVMIDAPVFDDPAFDWEGPYAGLYLLGETSTATGPLFGIGADFGVNILADAVLFGVELDGAWVNNGTWQVQGVGRLGVLASDEFLIYALAGIGTNSGTNAYVPIGVGAEFAVADNFTIKAQYEYHWDLTAAAQSAHVGKIGFNYHF